VDTYGQTRFDQAELPTADDNTIFTRRAPLKVPLNLMEWFPEKQLVDWIQEALEQVGERGKSGAQDPENRRVLLLTLLTLAYVTQQFRSSDVIRACGSEPAFKSLCGDKPPFKEELEHFRRGNRPLLQTLLALVLERAVERRFTFEPGTVPAGLKRDLLIRSEERMDIARHMNTWDD
jgi:hypothetical protein